MTTETDTVMDIKGLIDAIASSLAAASVSWRRVTAMGVDASTVVRGIRDRVGLSPSECDILSSVIASVIASASSGINQVGVAIPNDVEGAYTIHERPMTATIKRLLAEAPAPLPNQAPAVECGVMFPGGAQFMGSLSETPEGGLRMLSPAQQQTQRGVVQMVEQFFDHADVMVIALKREVKLESASGIIINS